MLRISSTCRGSETDGSGNEGGGGKEEMAIDLSGDPAWQEFFAGSVYYSDSALCFSNDW